MVSVIIPSYNHAHFLPESIESVLQQTFQDFEIVVIDDGSTDDTAAIVAKYPQVRYLRQENRGLAAARNTGIRETSGRFLIFLDADDKLLPCALEASLNCFQKHPNCGFVSGNFRRLTAEGISLARQPKVDSEHYLALLRSNYIGMHATVAYQRAAIEAVGGFNVHLPACEDYDLYLRIARRFPVARHEKVVADYRMHETNMSADAGLMLACTLRVLRAQRPHLGNNAKALAAYKQGIKFWQRYYGRRIIDQVTAGPEKVWLRQWVQATAALVKLAPRTVLGAGLKRVARRLLPARRQSGIGSPAVGKVRFGDLRRLAPVSRNFGLARAQPVDRFYVENFLREHSADIRGRVLEIGDNMYTRRFGGDRVTRSDVFYVREGNFIPSFEADDTSGGYKFDCVIMTQSLHLIYDLRFAVETVMRILTPGGVLLATVPGTVNRIERDTSASFSHWGFTSLSVRKLFADLFQPEQISVQAHGNVLSCIAFLEGIPTEKLSARELLFHDPLYPLLITICARKSIP